MKIIADLHLHSKYSRATSKNSDLENLVKWAKVKGIQLLSTADFTHPIWLAELKSKLAEVFPGIYKLTNSPELRAQGPEQNEVFFILGTELSSIYSQGGKLHRIHNLVFAPSCEVVLKINQELKRYGNLSSDGRPIFGLSVPSLCKILFNISEKIFIVPAHIWTPWFSLYGSNSGFDSIEECFGPYSSYIKAIETGLSSDPAMNWRIAELDNRAIISGSDAHSPQKIGREACVFNLEELNYESVIKTISGRNPSGLSFTIEFFPEEGKYHFTGHRNCQITYSPHETKEKGETCPICGKKLTLGVMHRVEELASREESYQPEDRPSYKSLIPLEEIIAKALGLQVGSSKVKDEYFKFIFKFQNEFRILLDEPIANLATLNPKVAEGIQRVREGKVNISPGYDGVYGEISIWGDEGEEEQKQPTLF